MRSVRKWRTNLSRREIFGTHTWAWLHSNVIARVKPSSTSRPSRAPDKLHLGGERKGVLSRSNAKHRASRSFGLIMQSGIRQSVCPSVREPGYRIAKEIGNLNLRAKYSTCRYILLALCVLSAKMLKIFSSSHSLFLALFRPSFYLTRGFARSATGKRGKSRRAYRIASRWVRSGETRPLSNFITSAYTSL